MTADQATDLRLVLTDLDEPVARRMERSLLDDLAVRYAGDGLELEPARAANYRPPRGAFVVAWLGADAVGAGGVYRVDEDIAELKRLWVDPPFRRRGIARALTTYREQVARQQGFKRLVFETGHNQPEQLAHAAASGYTPVEPWSTEFPFDPRVSYLAKEL